MGVNQSEIDAVRELFSTLGGTSGAPSGQTADQKLIQQMAANRAVNAKTAAGSSGTTSITLATGRPQDPLWYWREKNLPYDVWKPEELEKVRTFSRLLYVTHPVMGSAVDIFTHYPLAGMEITCGKDANLAEFYNDLFMDQLGYEEFLGDCGRQYWIDGEALVLGSFNELMGVWDADELVLPEDVNIIRSPFLKEPRFEMRLPEHIRTIIQNKKPELEYRQIIESYPELVSYAHATSGQASDDRMLIPVSNILMQQIKRTGDSFHTRGIPIMTRAFRALAQEEQLNAAQDAIASRLYTPLILAKLGASAQELGTSTPWVPTQGDLDAFIVDVNAALSADFRLIVHHFAVSMESVFGRENFPDLQADFDRLTERQLQAFGISKTMLSGASSGETYAADALNRDLVSQLLTRYQKRMIKFFRKRAAVVADAQGHYDFERKGGRPVPIMEEVLETDEETGEQRIVERPKLLIPDLKIRSMNIKDEDKFHDFIEALQSSGVPISMKTRLTNVPIDFEEEMIAKTAEQVNLAVANQEVRKKTYMALRAAGLPIAQDLLDDFSPKFSESQKAADEPMPLDTLGVAEPPTTMAIAPSLNELDVTDSNDPHPNDGQISDVVSLPRNQQSVIDLSRPAESDEMRADMPKASSRLSALMPESDAEAWLASCEKVAWIPPSDGDMDSPDPIQMPVLGSFRTRRSGMRDPAIFYRGGDTEPVSG